ncbi:PIN domain-containing protein [Nocardia amikacinitolerans]|uniref:PIN domain-containing protein n=1 Tax=Nocardia amikacinitolerans TaxID=756689 RepID=UPI0036CD93AD
MIVVLDSGALIVLEQRSAAVVAALEYAQRNSYDILVPATVLAQCWRNSPRQHSVSRFLKTRAVRVVDLTEPHAYAVGKLLADTGTADVVDAPVIVLARGLRAALVLTSDPDDLKALDPAVRLHVV